PTLPSSDLAPATRRDGAGHVVEGDADVLFHDLCRPVAVTRGKRLEDRIVADKGDAAPPRLFHGHLADKADARVDVVDEPVDLGVPRCRGNGAVKGLVVLDDSGRRQRLADL